jgi:acyl dehydratase
VEHDGNHSERGHDEPGGRPETAAGGARVVRRFDGVAELIAAEGQDLGFSQWHEVTQREINLFADATGDHQWIHVDEVRATAGPFRGTIAHGYYLLSIVPRLLDEIFAIDGVGMVVNTGVDELRFHRPVPIGTQVRAGARLATVASRPRGAADLTVEVGIHLPDGPRPACTALVRSMIRPPMSVRTSAAASRATASPPR